MQTLIRESQEWPPFEATAWSHGRQVVMPKPIGLRLSTLRIYLYPVVRRLHRAGLTADMVTIWGLLLSIGAAVAIEIFIHTRDTSPSSLISARDFLRVAFTHVHDHVATALASP